MSYQAHPLRIQLSRKKGYRKPEGAIVVTRVGKFGNPFQQFGENEYLYCDASHRRKILTPWVIFDHDQDIKNNAVTPQMVVEHYRRWLTGEFDEAGIVRPCLITAAQIASLRGKQLGCFCSLDKPCHADVLCELANPGGPTEPANP